jgi:hypothetical protein
MRLGLVLVAGLVVLALHSLGSADAPRSATRWEYKALPFASRIGKEDEDARSMTEQEKRLNELGEQGWELAEVSPEGRWGAYLLKRRKE